MNYIPFQFWTKTTCLHSLYVRAPGLSVNSRTDVAQFGTRDARRQFWDCPRHSRTIGNPSQQRWSPPGRPWPRGRPWGHILKSLALKPQVLGLEASSPRKLACLGLEDSTVFWIVKILWSAWKIFWKTFFWVDRLKNFNSIISRLQTDTVLV